MHRPSFDRIRPVLTRTISTAALFVAACQPSISESPLETPVAVIDRVIDGDTVDLRINDRVERVRLIGVDAPESVSPSVPEQCFGHEASTALRQLLPVGSEVTMTRDLEARDRYDRLLLYLHRTDDGLFVNRWLIESGLADAVSYEPNTSYRLDFEAARNDARTDAVGLWGRCDGPDQPLR